MITMTMTIQTIKKFDKFYTFVVEYHQHGREIHTFEYKAGVFETRSDAYRAAMNYLGLQNDADKIQNNYVQE